MISGTHGKGGEEVGTATIANVSDAIARTVVPTLRDPAHGMADRLDQPRLRLLLSDAVRRKDEVYVV
jgi:hypothetical protein